MRVLGPDLQGSVVSHGVPIHYEVTGSAGPTVLLMPTWTVVHQRLWKGQVPYLSRHFRVVSYDGPGNGGSGRPSDPAPYGHDAQVDHALSVLDATGTERAVVVSLSQAGAWALQLAAEHSSRVLGAMLICPSLALTEGHAVRTAGGPADVPPSRVPYVEPDPVEHWVKHDPVYWRDHHEDYLWFFFGMCFPEPHSTKQVEDCVGWGLETTPAVLATEALASRPDRELLETWCRSLTCPVLAVHGSRDRISPPSRSERVVELTGGEHVVLDGAGHLPLARDPVKVNLLIRDFVRSAVTVVTGTT